MANKTDAVLAIDPGRAKCGLAVVAACGNVLHRAVVPSAAVVEAVHNLRAEHGADFAVLGDSTTCRQWQALFHQTMPDLKLCVVDETGSTLEARGLYWQAHPPQGWRRFFPLSLQVPPEPVDDFAAVVLARRYFRRNAPGGLSELA